MKLTPTAAVTLAALSLLATCGPKGGNATAGGSGGAAASGPDVQISLSDLPRQKAGLWQTVIDDGDGKPATMTSCASGKVPSMPKMPPGCSQFSIKRNFLGRYIMDMNCTTPEFTMVMHSESTGDFQTHMSSDATMTMSTKQMPAKTTKMHTEAIWVPGRLARRRTTCHTPTQRAELRPDRASPSPAPPSPPTDRPAAPRRCG
jgi:hypothetical protein